MAELGLMGMTIPEEYGGGTGTVSYAIAVEELTRVDRRPSRSRWPLSRDAADLPVRKRGAEAGVGSRAGVRRGSAAFGLTESVPGRCRQLARRRLEDGEWVVNGSKMFITNAGTDITACVTITALTGGEGEISNIDRPQRDGRVRDRAADASSAGGRPTRELSFRDVRVPEEPARAARQGFQQFLEILDGGRISVAAMGLGLAQGAYDLASEYARERKQFGKPIASFQAIQFQLADMATEIEAGRNMVYKAAWLKDRDRPFGREAAMAKLYTGELSHRAANAALQIHGGYGFMDEYAISRLYRDYKRSSRSARARTRCSGWSSPSTSASRDRAGTPDTRH